MKFYVISLVLQLCLLVSCILGSHIEHQQQNVDAMEDIDTTPLDDEPSHFSHPRHASHRRHLIEGGRRVLYVNSTSLCNDPISSPCGPESQCEQVNETAYICQNEFYYGCISGCSPNSKCVRGSDLVYYCKCDAGYIQPQGWMPCRLDRR
jgi:hypothetical protein